MTCHVGVAHASGLVLLSDSQLSTNTSMWHGAQKQIAGADVLVGAAGSMLLIEELFSYVTHGEALTSANVNARIQSYFEQRVAPGARGAIEIAVGCSMSPGFSFAQFVPELLMGPTRPQAACALGSGAEFVVNAMTHDASRGYGHSPRDLVGALVCAFDYASYANRSLTVDDKYMVGFLHAGRAVQLWHPDIHPKFGDVGALERGQRASRRYDELVSAIETLRAEQRAFLELGARVSRGDEESFGEISQRVAALAIHRESVGQVVAQIVAALSD
jgi:hypothetical protein